MIMQQEQEAARVQKKNLEDEMLGKCPCREYLPPSPPDVLNNFIV